MTETEHDKLALLDDASETWLDGGNYSLAEMQEMLDRSVVRMIKTPIELGRVALAIKQVMGHGEFEEYLRKRYEEPGFVSVRTIRSAMKVAEAIGKLPKTENFPFSQLHKMKQYLLAGATEEDIDTEAGTIFGLTFDDLKAKKVKQLKEEIERYHAKIGKLESQIEEGSTQLDDAREQIEMLKDNRKLVGVDVFEAQKRLNNHYNVITGAMIRVFSEIKDPRRVSPELRGEVVGFFTKVFNLAEDYAVKVAAKFEG